MLFDPLVFKERDMVNYSRIKIDLPFIMNLFSRFGKVTEITVFPAPNFDKCFVKMQSVIEAFAVAKKLNGRLFNF